MYTTNRRYGDTCVGFKKCGILSNEADINGSKSTQAKHANASFISNYIVTQNFTYLRLKEFLSLYMVTILLDHLIRSPSRCSISKKKKEKKRSQTKLLSIGYNYLTSEVSPKKKDQLGLIYINNLKKKLIKKFSPHLLLHGMAKFSITDSNQNQTSFYNG